MNTKELQRVTFTQAERLKALGFDWECIGYYWINRNIGKGYEIINHNKYDDTYSAPTVALALKWIREVKGIIGTVEYYRYSDGAVFKGCRYAPGEQFPEFHWTQGFLRYEAAENALLDELLTLLEKIEYTQQ